MSTECTATRHGTSWAYSRYRCRCPEIVAKINERDRLRRRNLSLERKAQRARYARERTASRPNKSGRPKHASVLAEDIDQVVVQRLVGGELCVYTAFERREAVRRLRESGLSSNAIADLLRIHQRQVWRDLQRLGLVHREQATA